MKKKKYFWVFLERCFHKVDFFLARYFQIKTNTFVDLRKLKFVFSLKMKI